MSKKKHNSHNKSNNSKERASQNPKPVTPPQLPNPPIQEDNSLYEGSNIENLPQKAPTVFGLPVKAWSIIVLLSMATLFIIFIVSPFIASFILQIKYPDTNYSDALNRLDGGVTFLSVVGTIASVLSIYMTSSDRKRYDEEKRHSDELLSSIMELTRLSSMNSRNIESLTASNNEIMSFIHQIEMIDLHQPDGNWHKSKDSREAKEDG